MTARWMRWALSVGWCVVSVAALGCGSNTEPSTIESNEASQPALGSLHMPLVTPEQQAFRLRTALFDITRSGDAVLTLDSESDPAAVALDAELLQGSYEIQLRDGWALERQGDAGGPVSAALLTANPLGFDVSSARVTELVYGFATEQGSVTFGRGEASVSFNVAPIAPSAGCSVLDRSSCPSGQTCLLAGDTGRTFCAQPGALPVGAACSSDQCVAGAQCLSLDPSHPEQKVCARFCNPASSFCGCQGITTDPSVGLCTQATSGSVFSREFPGDSVAACNAWNGFRNELVSSSFSRVTVAGSRAANGGFECSEPVAASQICRSLRNNAFVSVSCQGHSWLVQDCGGGTELSVDSSCGCNFPGNTVRPCNGSNFGGVGTDTCSGIAQTIEVTCEGGSSPPPAVCGNGIIEAREVCDTNGIFSDVLPPGTPFGSTCNATCTAVIPPLPGPVCGNGVIEFSEVCDTNGIFSDVLPPGTPFGSTCNATCTAVIPPLPGPVCGNGVIETGEVCDTNGTFPDVLPAGTPAGSSCNAICTAIIPPGPVCGNGVLETGEACDHNGSFADVLPVGTPAGSTCNATCTVVIPPGPPVDNFGCLSCAQAKCASQYAEALGVSSTAANQAEVTQLFDCVIGPNWEAGGPIPSTSCFFAEPNQPRGSLIPCYCGNTPVSSCLASGPANNEEACGREIEDASDCNPVTASCVTQSGSNPGVPLGDVLQLLNCERAACEVECGFPFIIDDE